MKPSVPIFLITGALGNGKTTLLKNIVQTTDRRVAVLMDEFGEIAADSRILQGKHLNIVELAGGCVCCELTGEAVFSHGNLSQSFTFTTDHFLDLKRFEQVISALPPSVYRAKGFIRRPQNALLFNLVAGRNELEKFPADKTQLVFIGRDLNEDRENILSNLSKCEF
jgi:G3E family GTPase